MNDRIKTELQAGRSASIFGLTLLDLLDIQDSLGLGAGQLRILADSRACVDRDDTGEPWWVARFYADTPLIVQAESPVFVRMALGYRAEEIDRIEGPFAEPPILAYLHDLIEDTEWQSLAAECDRLLRDIVAALAAEVRRVAA